jgi:flagellin-like hook-associated protein FlgL
MSCEGMMDKDGEMKNILAQIELVREHMDKERATRGASSLRLDGLILELVRLYKRYTDLVNSV